MWVARQAQTQEYLPKFSDHLQYLDQAIQRRYLVYKKLEGKHRCAENLHWQSNWKLTISKNWKSFVTDSSIPNYFVKQVKK